MRAHEALVEHSDGRTRATALARGVPVGAVTRELLGAVRALAGPVEINATPQEVPWSVPLDEDEEHASYDPELVSRYFAAATRAALVLAAFRAPYRGRSTPVNAWWGSFDLAVNLFSGEPADPPSEDFIMRNAMDAQEVAVGWWPGDARYGRRRSTRTRTRRPRASRRRRCRRRPLAGRRSWRVRPRLGRRARGAGPARGCADIRALGVSPRVRGVRLGRVPCGQRGGLAAAAGGRGRLIASRDDVEREHLRGSDVRAGGGPPVACGPTLAARWARARWACAASRSRRITSPRRPRPRRGRGDLLRARRGGAAVAGGQDVRGGGGQLHRGPSRRGGPRCRPRRAWTCVSAAARPGADGAAARGCGVVVPALGGAGRRRLPFAREAASGPPECPEPSADARATWSRWRMWRRSSTAARVAWARRRAGDERPEPCGPAGRQGRAGALSLPGGGDFFDY